MVLLGEGCAREAGAVVTPSHVESPWRERLIEAGMLRPRRYRHGLLPIQLPPGTVVFRLDELTRARAERKAMS